MPREKGEFLVGEGLYSGPALSVADSKGRFVVPVAMRHLTKENSGGQNRLCVSLHEKFGCAIGFGLAHKQQLADDIDREEERATALGRDYDRDDAWQRKFSIIEDVVFDDGGRFSLPFHIRAMGGIEDMIFFTGAGRHFQMWNPGILETAENVYAPLKQTCRLMVAEWEANPKNRKGA